VSQRYDYWGYRKIYDLLHQARGLAVGRERVRLIRRLEGLQVQSMRPK
jgi:HTH-like domain